MSELENNVIIFFKKALLHDELKKSSYITDFCKNEDDAFYIFLEFLEVFKINKGYLDIDKYFYDKPSFRDLLRFKKKDYSRKKRISIEHLIKVAEKGEWFDPI